MQTEERIMEHREFVSLVCEMRNAQKMYFRYRTTEYLNKSKTLERQVDEEIRNIENAERQKREPELPFE